MIFSNVNVGKILGSPTTNETHEPLDSEATTNSAHKQLMDDVAIAGHNIRTLEKCLSSNARYRIRHGNYNGRKVAIIVKAETFLDKLFSYIPSGCLLKRRFSNSIKNAIKECSGSHYAVMTFLMRGGTIPNMSPAEVSNTASPAFVYNPWPDLPPDFDTIDYPQDGHYAHSDEIKNGTQIGFYHQHAPNAIFSNMSKIGDDKPLAFVDVPGVVTTASCAETLFQAGKYYNNPSARKAILGTKCGTDACTISQAKKDDQYIETVDEYFYQDNRDVQLMLKVVRTRAQQDTVFRHRLIDSDGALIFEIAPNDRKWGCVAVLDHQGNITSYDGENLLGRILMMVRREVLNNSIQECPLETVIRNRGIHTVTRPSNQDCPD